MADTERCWLVKESPATFSIDDLEEAGSTPWYGVRNYEARNNMQEMREGDLVLYYHSGANPPGVVGIAKVAKQAYPDETQFDEASPYHDPDSDPNDPTWWNVDIGFVEKLPRKIPLKEIKADGRLDDMVLVNRSRLSVQPVTPKELEIVRSMAST